MKIFEIVSEAEGDFAKYRQLGQNPLNLVGHLAKEVPDSAVSAVDKTSKLGKKLLVNQQHRPPRNLCQLPQLM